MTVLGILVGFNGLSSGLLLKSYINYVHNRPMDVGLSPSLLEHIRVVRSRQLALLFNRSSLNSVFIKKLSHTSERVVFSVNSGESHLEKNNLINSSLFVSN